MNGYKWPRANFAAADARPFAWLATPPNLPELTEKWTARGGHFQGDPDTLTCEMTKLRIAADLQVWIDVRKRYRLSHAVVQMARELGMNPKKMGGLANARQEPWKAPLPEFIADLYSRRFGKDIPNPAVTIEDIARRRQEKKELKRANKASRATGDAQAGRK